MSRKLNTNFVKIFYVNFYFHEMDLFLFRFVKLFNNGTLFILFYLVVTFTRGSEKLWGGGELRKITLSSINQYGF